MDTTGGRTDDGRLMRDGETLLAWRSRTGATGHVYPTGRPCASCGYGLAVVVDDEAGDAVCTRCWASVDGLDERVGRLERDLSRTIDAMLVLSRPPRQYSAATVPAVEQAVAELGSMRRAFADNEVVRRGVPTTDLRVAYLASTEALR